MPSALLCGYFGFGNLGDEAVLAGAIRALRAARPTLEITVLSADPDATSRVHRVAAVRRDPAAAWRAIPRRDLFIAGGGSLVQDATSWRSPLYYLGLQLRANRSAPRSAVLAQGVGPLRRRWIRMLARRAFDGADFVSVRDRASLVELRSLGVRRDVAVAGDLALAAEPAPPEAARDVLGRAGAAGGGPVVVAPRPWPGVDEAALAEGVRRTMAALPGAAVVVLPMFPAQDRAACERIAARIAGAAVIREPLDPAVAMAVVAQAALVVAVRLHAAIFAASAGVPVVGIAYDPKVRALFADLEAPGLVEVPLQPGEIERRSAEVLSAAGLSERLRRGSAEMRTSAEDAVRRVASLV